MIITKLLGSGQHSNGGGIMAGMGGYSGMMGASNSDMVSNSCLPLCCVFICLYSVVS